MSILGMQGFEAGREDDDNIIGNTLTYYSASGLPVGSASGRRGYIVNKSTAPIRSPWVSGEVAGATPREPSTTVSWFHAHLSITQPNTKGYFGTGRSGAYVVTLGRGTGGTIRLFVGGSYASPRLVATSAVLGLSGSWYRYHVYVDQQLGGEIRVYLEGDLTTPVLTYTLVAGDILALSGKPNEFIFQADGITGVSVDDLFALDPADAIGVVDIQLLAAASVQPSYPLGNGFYTAWTGTFADIDGIPASDANFIDTAVVDQASTFNVTAASQAQVFFAQTKARMTRTGTVAGSQVQMRIREGITDKDEVLTTAPGSGNVHQQHHTAPDGTAWDKTKFDASQFGPVSRT